MANSSQSSKDQAMLKWFNQHRQEIAKLYKSQYIAYDETGIVAHGKNLDKVLEIARNTKEDFAIYLVPSRQSSVKILPIYFRSVVRHQWEPNYHIMLKNKEKEVKANMLVDSGAEISLISHQVGIDLGYSLADSESKLSAETIGGNVEYVLRNIEMIIDNHHLTVPSAWLQTPVASEQLLLGREIVFDNFNIEFRQADEQVIFTWRGNPHE